MLIENQLKNIWLQPGELAFLMEHYGVGLDKSSALKDMAIFQRWPEQRPVKYFLEDVKSKVSDVKMKAYLQTLARASSLIRIKQGYRRKPVGFSYAFAGVQAGEFVLLRTRADTGVEMVFPFSLETLTEELCAPLEHIINPGLSQDYLIQLAPTGMAALLALADLFNETYPFPDPDWHPNKALTFTLKYWHERIIKGSKSATHESLIAAFADLTGSPLPQVTMNELEFWLLAFMNQLYLGLKNSDALPSDPNAVYFVARDLLLILRCLAWWDLSLGLEQLPYTKQKALQPLLVLQATVLWQFILPTTEPPLIETQILDGLNLKQRVYNYLKELQKSTPGRVATPPAKREVAQTAIPIQLPSVSAKKQAVAIPAAPFAPPQPAGRINAAVGKKFCRQCGSALSAGARFCKSCGAMMVAAPVNNLCPGCGQPVRAGAAFCRNCGQKIS